MNVGAIRTGLQARCQAATMPATVTLHCYDQILDSIVPPAAVIVPDSPFVEYVEVINSELMTLHFRVTLLTERTSERTGQALLDSMLSAGSTETASVVMALEADRTLAGACQALVVTQAHDYGVTEIGGVSYYKCDLLVDVTGKRG